MRRVLFVLLVAALCAGLTVAARADLGMEDVLERIFEEVDMDIDIDDDAHIRVGEDVRVQGGEEIDNDVVAVNAGVRVAGGAKIDGTVLAVGGNVRISGGGFVDGDVIAVNGDVHLAGGSRVDGDVAAVGGHVYRGSGSVVEGEVRDIRVDDRVGAALEKSIAAAATLTPTVEHDISPRLHGEIERTRTDDKDIAGFGDVIEIPPDVRHKGDIAVFGGVLDVAGAVDGDVVTFGTHVRVFTTGEISGDLATFGSIVEHDVPLDQWDKKPLGLSNRGDGVLARRYGRMGHGDVRRPMAIVGLIVLGSFGIVVLLFNLLLEPVLESAEVELTQGYTRAFLIGLILEAAVPPLAALLAITFVLAPVAILLVLASALGATVAMGLVSRQLGRRILGGPGANGTLTRTLTGYGSLVGLAAFGQVLLLLGAPAVIAWTVSILGYFVVLCAMTLGLGAVAMAQFGRWNRNPAPPVGPPAVAAVDD